MLLQEVSHKFRKWSISDLENCLVVTPSIVTWLQEVLRGRHLRNVLLDLELVSGRGNLGGFLPLVF